MPDKIDIVWTDNPKTPTEDVFKEEKTEKLQQEAAAEEQQEENKEQGQEQEGVSRGLEELLIMLYEKAADAKNLEPLTDNEKEYLAKHFERLNQKYSKKVGAIASPEAEAGLAALWTFVPKLVGLLHVKKEVDKNAAQP